MVSVNKIIKTPTILQDSCNTTKNKKPGKVNKLLRQLLELLSRKEGPGAAWLGPAAGTGLTPPRQGRQQCSLRGTHCLAWTQAMHLQASRVSSGNSRRRENKEIVTRSQPELYKARPAGFKNCSECQIGECIHFREKFTNIEKQEKILEGAKKSTKSQVTSHSRQWFNILKVLKKRYLILKFIYN